MKDYIEEFKDAFENYKPEESLYVIINQDGWIGVDTAYDDEALTFYRKEKLELPKFRIWTDDICFAKVFKTKEDISNYTVPRLKMLGPFQVKRLLPLHRWAKNNTGVYKSRFDKMSSTPVDDIDNKGYWDEECEQIYNNCSDIGTTNI